MQVDENSKAICSGILVERKQLDLKSQQSHLITVPLDSLRRFL